MYERVGVFVKNILKTKEKGNLIVISGPSGAGKDSIVEKLKDTTLKLRGSSNQHIYYNQKGKLINVTDKIQNNITI